MIRPPQKTCVLFFKPYGVVSRFTPEGAWLSLKTFGPFPEGVYPVGRLDADSEGLLFLTDDMDVKRRLTHPSFGHPKTYTVQVERIPSEGALERLRQGVVIEGQRTRPAEARLLEREPDLPPRPIPIRYRKNVPTAWLEIVLREGRNRQVRRMTAAVGHPTLRLVRTRVGEFTLDGLEPGQHRVLSREEFMRLRRWLDAP
ncbi:MAG: pseudouridine synthase [Bacteroidetes bacterium]|nr:pseudouridine synthase [Bacteroidota bacterium]